MPDGVGTTHHVKIGDQFYLIRPGTYRKRPGPLFGARFTTGDPDYNNLSFWQHWVQHCWVGGFGAETWQDDAMFDEGVGIDATQHEVMVLARDLGPTSSRDAVGNWDLTGADGPQERQFTVFNDELYVLSYGLGAVKGRLFRFDRGTSTWVNVRNFTEEVRCMEPFKGYLIFGDGGSNLTRMDSSEVFDTIAKPGGVTDIPRAMKVYRGQLYVGFGRDIWRLKRNWEWDGSTAFYEASGVDRFIHAEVHLGMLYFASRNGHILRTDANNTFDIWQFDPGPRPVGMRSFDGRLFVATTEPLDGTTAQQAVIYQFTGAAVTELKRWGKVGKDISTGRLRVVGKRLMFGAASLLGMGDAEGFGVAAYDPVEDAYHMWSVWQGNSYAPGTEGINHTVDDIIFYRGWVWVSVRGEGIFRTKLSYKDVTRYQATYDTTKAGGSPGSKNGGWYESSDFDAGTPGLLKYWNAITIHVDLPTAATSVWLDISTDGGQTWNSIGSIVGDGVTTRYSTTFKLSVGGEDVRTTRLKYRITLRTTDSTRSPQLRGVVVRYLPLPEPNWQWEMRLLVSESQELLDDTVQELNEAAIDAKVNLIENAFRSQELVHFTDVDGTQWTTSGGKGVLITDYAVNRAVIGPTTDGPLEAEISVTLLEAVEAY